MTTLDSTFLIIAAVCISLFFILSAALTIYSWIVFHKLVKKAETAIDSVESVTSAIREVGKIPSLGNIFKLLRFIMRLSKKL